MAEIRHLANAQTEAIIDFRVKLPDGFQAEQFSGLQERLRARYPNAEKRQLIMQEFGVKENGKPLFQAPEDKGLHGFWFRSEDERNIAQFRVDGFTFNRMKPYTSWEEVLKEARNLWELYVEASAPEVVTRIAVRYINHLAIPRPVPDFSRYFTAPLPVPAHLSLRLTNFLTRVVVEDQEADVTANVAQALADVADPKHVTFLLDIDAYKARDFDVGDPAMWSTFGVLREFKNRIFFGSITEETARLFE